MSTLTPVTSSYGPEQLARIDAAIKKLGQEPTRQTRAKFQHDLVLDLTRNIVEPDEVDPVCPLAGEWQLLWADEFNGDEVDPEKWNVQNNSTFGDGNDELQTYMRENVTVEDGTLRLTATEDLHSGMVTTRAQGGDETFQYTYGYVEARCRLPKGGGYWPAFWLVGGKGAPGWPAYGEFDIFEGYGTFPRSVECTVHWSENGVHKQEGGRAIDVGRNTDWHTYGLDWTPDGVTFYIDGKPVQSWNANNPGKRIAVNSPHTIILNLAIGGTGPSRYHGWDGTWDEGDFPGTLEVDYVRVWQRR